MSSPTFTFGHGYGAAAQPAAKPELVKDTTTRDFPRDVLETSKTTPVLVDFWAPWCGPCKQLTPILEKAVTAAAGAVRLVKMNIDDHPQIAGQLGIQSIPAVIAFVGGKPVDGFMGALPESQVKQFIERVAGPVGPTPVEELLTEAQALLAAGDAQTAGEAYSAVLQMEPDNIPAHAGLARALTALGRLEDAAGLLDRVPAAKQSDAAVAGARAELELAIQAEKLGDTAELQARVAANPADFEAKFELAVALATKGDRQGAVDLLVDIVKRDRSWNEDGARKQLVQFFEAWGPMDSMTSYGRRKLSAVLFS